MIDLPPEHLERVRAILREHVPEAQVWAFGSRVNGTARPHSDLDLVVVADAELPRRAYYRLLDAFEESDLPIRVDVLDWYRIDAEFQAIIRRRHVLIVPATAS